MKIREFASAHRKELISTVFGGVCTISMLTCGHLDKEKRIDDLVTIFRKCSPMTDTHNDCLNERNRKEVTTAEAERDKKEYAHAGMRFAKLGMSKEATKMAEKCDRTEKIEILEEIDSRDKALERFNKETPTHTSSSALVPLVPVTSAVQMITLRFKGPDGTTIEGGNSVCTINQGMCSVETPLNTTKQVTFTAKKEGFFDWTKSITPALTNMPDINVDMHLKEVTVIFEMVLSDIRIVKFGETMSNGHFCDTDSKGVCSIKIEPVNGDVFFTATKNGWKTQSFKVRVNSETGGSFKGSLAPIAPFQRKTISTLE